MANYNYSKHFNKDMSSEEALHEYARLLKTIPKDKTKELDEAYGKIEEVILKRECEEVKEGWMY